MCAKSTLDWSQSNIISCQKLYFWVFNFSLMGFKPVIVQAKNKLLGIARSRFLKPLQTKCSVCCLAKNATALTSLKHSKEK